MAEQFDVIVVSAEQAGPALAVRAGREGLNTSIIERHRSTGTCINNGCVPTKTQAASAGVAHMSREDATVQTSRDVCRCVPDPRWRSTHHKVTVDAETKRLLGAAIPYAHGDEVVQEILVVMAAGLPCTHLNRMVHFYPTVAELLPMLRALRKLME